MSTKNNPGKYDCYSRAANDEPMFVLLARDPLAPLLVELWAKLRDLNGCEAHPHRQHDDKVLEAMETALAMRIYRRETIQPPKNSDSH